MSNNNYVRRFDIKIIDDVLSGIKIFKQEVITGFSGLSGYNFVGDIIFCMADNGMEFESLIDFKINREIFPSERPKTKMFYKEFITKITTLEQLSIIKNYRLSIVLQTINISQHSSGFNITTQIDNILNYLQIHLRNMKSGLFWLYAINSSNIKFVKAVVFEKGFHYELMNKKGATILLPIYGKKYEVNNHSIGKNPTIYIDGRKWLKRYCEENDYGYIDMLKKLSSDGFPIFLKTPYTEGDLKFDNIAVGFDEIMKNIIENEHSKEEIASIMSMVFK